LDEAAIESVAESVSDRLAAVRASPGSGRARPHSSAHGRCSGSDAGISFEEYCKRLGNPEFITADELADIILFCWNLPQRVCVRDIVVMPTTSSFT
jgi:NADP-dependent 3-hydroxy acid dehydrogenase YdfG